MGRPKGLVVTAADRKMREARAAFFAGDLDARSFHAAMGDFNRWDEDHFETCGTAGCTGMPDLDELADLPAKVVEDAGQWEDLAGGELAARLRQRGCDADLADLLVECRDRSHARSQIVRWLAR